MAHLVATDAHVSEGLVVPRGRGPGFVRAVRVVSYGGPSERVRKSFDVVHSRLFDSYSRLGGACQKMRLGLLPAGARASVERVPASEGGAIRAFSFADATASKGAETRLERRRDGFYCGAGHCLCGNQRYGAFTPSS